VEDCTKAVELDESYIKAYLRRAKTYLDKEEFDLAVADYEKVYKLDKSKGKCAVAVVFLMLGAFFCAKSDVVSDLYKFPPNFFLCAEHQQLLKQAKLELKKSKRKDYYKILGVNKEANEDEIKKAYKKRALMHHPGYKDRYS
jgi:DnaJ family protein C protein 7